MKIVSKLCLALLLEQLTLFPQVPDTLWTKTIGGEGPDNGSAVEQTRDGGFIIVGNKEYDIWLIKTDMNGDTLWSQNLGGSFGSDVKQTTDGGYIITGTKEGFYYDDDVVLIKTDSSGSVIWEKTFGTPPLGDPIIDAGYSVQQTTDKGYVVAGIKGFIWTPMWPPDLWLIKTDSLGNYQWSRVHHHPQGWIWEEGSEVQVTSDNGYIIVGSAGTSSATKNVWLIKTNSNGDTLWTKTFGGMEDDHGNSVQKTTDGGFLIAGSTKSFGAGEDDIWLIKTDANGDTVWTKTYGGAGGEEGYSVINTIDDGFIIVGYSDSYGAGEDDLWIIRTDKNGNKLWAKTLGGIEDESGSSIFQSADSCYIITGYTRSFGAGESDVWLIKIENENGGIVNVIQPNGGEYWFMEETRNILWASNLVDSVRIELSIDNGNMWETIAESTPSDGLFEWVVQAQQTSFDCRIKITDTKDYTITDESDTTFVIDLIPSADDSHGENSLMEYMLHQNYPNPFNSSTVIRYSLPHASNVEILVFNTIGEVIKRKVIANQEAGNYELVFNGNNLSSGTYFFRLQAGYFIETKKIVLMK